MNLLLIKLADIRQAELTAPGILQKLLLAGEIQGDRLAISRRDFDAVNREVFGDRPLGSMLHAIMAPAVRTLDSMLGTRLADCGNCAGRELKLNAAGRG